ncbi:MAG: hypothetical protein Kow00124_25100 [Anaerolineae bacterium]
MQNLTILLIDDDPAAPDMLREALDGPTVEPLASLDALSARAAAVPGPLPVVVSGPCGDLSVAQAAAGAITAAPGYPVFVLDPAPELRTGITLIKQGAADYLPRDAEGLATLREALAAPTPGGLMGCLPPLFDALAMPLLMVRPRGGRPIYASPAAARLTGLPLDHLMTQDAADLWHSPAEWQALLDRLAAEDSVTGLELRLRREADGPLWVSLSAGRVDLNGCPALLIALHDVTRRRQIEEDLRTTREHYELAADAGVAIWDYHLETGTVSAASALAGMLGFSIDEIGEDPAAWLARVHPDDREQVSEAVRRCVRGESSPLLEIEYRMLHRDGSPRWILTRARLLADESGTPARLAGSNTDITRLKNAELALKESEDRYKRLAENAPDMIFRWSYKKGFEYVNPAAVEVIGYTPEEHYSDPGLGYRSIHIDDIPIYESVFSELADPEGPRRYCVIRWHHKEGHQVHVEMRMSPIFDERGQLIAIEGIARDVSQHIIARKRLQELAARITRAHEEERRRLARELHDEIGQALTAAKMRVRMVENALPEGAHTAREKLALLGDLCTEVLATVRALSHELRPPLLDEMGWGPAIVWLCESFSERTGLPVTCVNRGGAARLDPDVELVAYRVVQEALTNVVRHAGATTARVELDLQDDGLHVLVSDDGRGFDMAALTLADQPGVGLGLLGMRERVDAVGGELQIHTAPGRGTQVRAALPLGKKEAELL